MLRFSYWMTLHFKPHANVGKFAVNDANVWALFAFGISIFWMGLSLLLRTLNGYQVMAKILKAEGVEWLISIFWMGLSLLLRTLNGYQVMAKILKAEGV